MVSTVKKMGRGSRSVPLAPAQSLQGLPQFIRHYRRDSRKILVQIDGINSQEDGQRKQVGLLHCPKVGGASHNISCLIQYRH